MSFQKLTPDCLRKVRPLLVNLLPHSTQILNLIDLKLKGKVLSETFKTEFQGIPGTEIINVTWNPTKSFEKVSVATNLIYIPPKLLNPESLERSNLSKEFQSLINWKQPWNFESLPFQFAPHLEKLIEDNNGIVKSKVPHVLLYLPKESAEKLDTKRWEKRAQGKFLISSLSPNYAKKMNSYWQYGPNDGGAFLAEMIKTFGNAKGIFRESQKNNKGLVSWGILTQLGTIGCLYTLDEARGSGLGQWVYEECCKVVAEESIIPCCEVAHDNKASRKLMENVGKIFITDNYWLDYMPKG